MVSGFSCSEFFHCLKFRVLLKPSLKLFQKSFTPEIWLNRFHFSFFHILVIRISINIKNISYMFHIFSSKKTITCFMSKFPPISPPFSFFNRICTDIIYYLRLNLPLIIIFNKWNRKRPEDHICTGVYMQANNNNHIPKWTFCSYMFMYVFYISCYIAEKTYLCFWDWLILLSIMVLSCICAVVKYWISFFLLLSDIP